MEIKYPLAEEVTAYNIKVADIDDYVDCILACVLEHAGSRPIFFSSFSPEVCLALRFKQGRYPVFFLSEGGKGRYSDARCNSVRAAVRFALLHRLDGIVVDSFALLASPMLIRKVKSSGLLLATYGGANNHPDRVKLQHSYGVDLIICDHVKHILTSLS